MILHYLRSAALAALIAGASFAAHAEEAAKAPEAAKAEDKKADAAKSEEKKAETAKADEKKEEPKKAEEKKEEAAKADEKKEEPKKAEEKKEEAAKADEKKEEPKKAEEKKEEAAKADEKKEEPKKAEEKKEEAAKADEKKEEDKKEDASSKTEAAPKGALGADTAAIEKIIGEYLRKNPETVYNALMSYQQKQEQERDQKSASLVKEKLGDLTAAEYPSYGAKDGDITIVEFFDYSCGYCKRAFPQVYDLVKQDGKVKVVFHDFPILGAGSKLNAQAALAVHLTQPDKYFTAHSLLMKNRYSSKESVLEALKAEGLDTDKIAAKMDSDEVKKALDKTADLARQIGVQGTPAFIIGERFVPGAISLEDMKKIIEEERQKKKN